VLAILLPLLVLVLLLLAPLLVLVLLALVLLLLVLLLLVLLSLAHLLRHCHPRLPTTTRLHDHQRLLLVLP
jgi:hypothetical protein